MPFFVEHHRALVGLCWSSWEPVAFKPGVSLDVLLAVYTGIWAIGLGSREGLKNKVLGLSRSGAVGVCWSEYERPK